MNTSQIGGKLLGCFSREELVKLLEIDGKSKLRKEMTKQGLSFDDLRRQPQKMGDIVSAISQINSADRDIHEIFASVFVFADFYGNGSGICFELPKFDPRRDRIESLDDLNRFRDGSITDFIFKSKDGFRQFQLKRYRGKLNAQDIFDFIKEKIVHYGSDLGDMNLLVVLQSTDRGLSGSVFHEVHEQLKACGIKSSGWILISYNENNETLIMNQVYPSLTTTRIPLHLPGSRDRVRLLGTQGGLLDPEGSASGQ